jgi:hypothetical protein
MTRTRITLLAAVAALALWRLSAPAGAQDSVGRYVMNATPDGFLKMDTKTGDVSDCRRAEGGFRCTLAPDERSALQAEIDRLSQENASLRQSLAASGGSPPATQARPQARPSPGGPPSDEDFDRTLSLMERFMRRFMTILREDPGKQQNQL